MTSQRVSERPSDFEYAVMSRLAYYDEPDNWDAVQNKWIGKKQDDLSLDILNAWRKQGWELYDHINNACGGYYGRAYINRKKQQLVITHRGTGNAGSLWADLEGVLANVVTYQQVGALEFTKEALEKLRDDGHPAGPGLTDWQLSMTGHSLGGWLAGVTAAMVYRLGVRESLFHQLRPWAVTFETPGLGPMLNELARTNIEGEPGFEVKKLDFTSYNGRPNIITCANTQVGLIIVIETGDVPEPENETVGRRLRRWFFPELVHTAAQHSMVPLLRQFDPDTGEVRPTANPCRAYEWPTLEARSARAVERVLGVSNWAWVNDFLNGAINTFQAAQAPLAPSDAVNLVTKGSFSFANPKRWAGWMLEQYRGVRRNMPQQGGNEFRDVFQKQQHADASLDQLFQEGAEEVFKQLNYQPVPWNGKWLPLRGFHLEVRKYLRNAADTPHYWERVKKYSDKYPDANFSCHNEGWDLFGKYYLTSNIFTEKPEKGKEIGINVSGSTYTAAVFRRRVTVFVSRYPDAFSRDRWALYIEELKPTRVVPAEALLLDEVEIKLEKFNKALRDEYKKREYREVNQPLGGKLDVSTGYINLALVDESASDKGRKFTGAYQNPGSERLSTQGSAVRLNEIFSLQKEDSRPVEHIVLIGGPGSGKSTTVKYMAHQWASQTKRFWPEAQWVFVLPMRELPKWEGLRADQLPDLSQVIYEYWFTQKLKMKRKEISHDNWTEQIWPDIKAKGVYLIVDGLDEATLNQRQWFFNAQDEASSWIVTSRPYGAENIPAWDVRFQLEGLTRENINSYIRYSIDDVHRQQEMILFLQRNPIVFDMARTPLCLAILSRVSLVEGRAVTLSTLYAQMETELWTRYSERCHDNDVAEHPETVRRFLQVLACWGMENNSSIIPYSTVDTLYRKLTNNAGLEAEQLRSHLVDSGFVNPLDSTEALRIQDIEFIHRSFQEWLTAQKLVAQLNSNNEHQVACNWVTQHRYQSAYYWVLAFTAGQLRNSTQGGLQRFFDTLAANHKDFTRGVRLQVLVRCLEESQRNFPGLEASLRTRFQELLAAAQQVHGDVDDDKLSDHTISLRFRMWERAFKNCTRVASRVLSQLAIDAIPRFPNLLLRLRLLTLLIKEWLITEQSRLLPTLKELAAKSNPKSIRFQAIFLIGVSYVPRDSAAPEMMNILLDDNEDDEIRDTAGEALGNIAAASGLPDQQQKELIRIVEKEKISSGIRGSAIWALGRLGILNEAVRSALEKLLKAPNSSLQSSSISAFERLGVTNEVLAAMLETALQEEEVAQSARLGIAKKLLKLDIYNDFAVDALCEIAEGTQHMDRLDAVWALGGLDILNDRARSSLCELALGNTSVQKDAIKALGKTAAFSDEEVVQTLYSVLKEGEAAAAKTAAIESLHQLRANRDDEVLTNLLLSLNPQKSTPEGGTRDGLIESLCQMLEGDRDANLDDDSSILILTTLGLFGVRTDNLLVPTLHTLLSPDDPPPKLSPRDDKDEVGVRIFTGGRHSIYSSAIKALKRLGASDQETIRVLCKILDNWDIHYEECLAAVQALNELNINSNEVVTRFSTILRNRETDSHPFEHVIKGLGKFARADQEVATELCNVAIQVPLYRSDAIAALSNFDENIRGGLLPALSASLRDNPQGVFKVSEVIPLPALITYCFQQEGRRQFCQVLVWRCLDGGLGLTREGNRLRSRSINIHYLNESTPVALSRNPYTAGNQVERLKRAFNETVGGALELENIPRANQIVPAEQRT